MAEAVASGRTEQLAPRLQALCTYALKLTREPAAVTEADVAALRAVGLDDRAIVDANQVVSYFNYVNRIADGLGVELESSWPPETAAERDYDPFAVPADLLPWVTVEQMRELDRVAVDELGLSLERMLEHAGRGLVAVARKLLGGDVRGRAVLVLAGSGGNGAGGMAAARQLAAAGAEVAVLLASPPERLGAAPGRQHAILLAAGIFARYAPGADLPDGDLVIDALLGYSQEGPPRGETARLIAASAGRRVLALDTPSGLELATGRLHEPHVRAAATVTLAAPKAALRLPLAAGPVGRLYVADLSIPPAGYARSGIPWATPFGHEPVVAVAP